MRSPMSSRDGMHFLKEWTFLLTIFSGALPLESGKGTDVTMTLTLNDTKIGKQCTYIVANTSYTVIISLDLANIHLKDESSKLILFRRRPGQEQRDEHFCDWDLLTEACEKRGKDLCCVEKTSDTKYTLKAFGVTTAKYSRGRLRLYWPNAPAPKFKETFLAFPEIRDLQSYLILNNRLTLFLTKTRSCHLEMQPGQAMVYKFCTSGLDEAVLTMRFPGLKVVGTGKDCVNESYISPPQSPLPTFSFGYREACGRRDVFSCRASCQKPHRHLLYVNDVLVDHEQEVCKFFVRPVNNILTFCCVDPASQCQAVIMTQSLEVTGSPCVNLSVEGQTSVYHFTYNLCGEEGGVVFKCTAITYGLSRGTLVVVYVVLGLLATAMVVSPTIIWVIYKGRRKFIRHRRKAKLKSIMREHSTLSIKRRKEQVHFDERPKMYIYYID